MAIKSSPPSEVVRGIQRGRRPFSRNQACSLKGILGAGWFFATCRWRNWVAAARKKRCGFCAANRAWETIVAQYRGIVLAYVGQHSASTMMREPDDYWVNRAFQRFWSAVGADRFGQFPDLAALLKYLKLCVHSVLMDEIRARRAAPANSLDEIPETAAAPHNAEHSVIGKLAGEELWAAISAELQDEPEQVVAHLSFRRDFKPSEIFNRHPGLYASVADVYRIKRNLIERLRRNPEVRAFLTS
jgi:DNA-directed RNA polymerase specialized sigma24 family protein